MDFMQKDEMHNWVVESEKVLSTAPSKFGVLIDMRELKPLGKDAELEMQNGQGLYKKKGMERSVVILDNKITAMQFKRIARETGIYDWERYLDASSTPNWEEVGINWLTNAVDPDK